MLSRTQYKTCTYEQTDFLQYTVEQIVMFSYQ